MIHSDGHTVRLTPSLDNLPAPDSVSEGELSAVLFACIAKVRPKCIDATFTTGKGISPVHNSDGAHNRQPNP